MCALLWLFLPLVSAVRQSGQSSGSAHQQMSDQRIASPPGYMTRAEREHLAELQRRAALEAEWKARAGKGRSRPTPLVQVISDNETAQPGVHEGSATPPDAEQVAPSSPQIGAESNTVEEAAIGIVVDEHMGPITEKLPIQQTLGQYFTLPTFATAPTCADYQYVCKLCGEQCSRGSALASHMRHRHPPRQCESPGAAIAAFLVEPVAGPPLEDEYPPDEPFPEHDGDAGDEVKVVDGGRRENRRGSDKRQRYTAATKLYWLDRHAEAMSMKRVKSDTRNPDGTAAGTTVPYMSLVSWKKPAYMARLMEEVKNKRQKRLKARRGKFQWSPSMEVLHKKLRKRIKKMRKDGRAIRWRVCLNEARHIYQAIVARDPAATWPVVRRTGLTWQPAKAWIRKWLSDNMVFRKPKSKRGISNERAIEIMDLYLLKLRYVIGFHPAPGTIPQHIQNHMIWDDRTGYFPMHLRFSADQVPLEVDHQSKGKSWFFKNEKHPSVKGAGAGSEKRFATLQICVSADGSYQQPKLMLLFRGQGRIGNREKSQYPDSIVVRFQKCAWFDRAMADEWLNSVWAPYLTSLPDADKKLPKLLVTDNLDASRTTTWRDELFAMGTVAHLGEPGSSTHLWQYVDRGVGSTMKFLIQQIQDEELLNRQSRKRWVKMSASQRRIHLATIVAQAWERLIYDYKPSLTKMATASGLRIELSQSGLDTGINLEQLVEYHVPEFKWAPEYHELLAEWKQVILPESASSSDHGTGSSSSDHEGPLLPPPPEQDGGDESDITKGWTATEVATLPSEEEAEIDFEQTPAVPEPQTASAELPEMEGAAGFLHSLFKRAKHRGELSEAIRFAIRQFRVTGMVNQKRVLRATLQTAIEEFAELADFDF